MTVYGQMQAAKAQQQQYNYAAQVAANNQKMAQQAANQATADGERKAAQAALANKQLISRQQAVFASNGVETNSGSALDIRGDTAEAGKLNELDIKNNADRQALGFLQQGANFNAAAAQDQLAASEAGTAGITGAGGSLLSGAGLVADKWYKYQNAFPGSSTDPTLNLAYNTPNAATFGTPD